MSPCRLPIFWTGLILSVSHLKSLTYPSQFFIPTPYFSSCFLFACLFPYRPIYPFNALPLTYVITVWSPLHLIVSNSCLQFSRLDVYQVLPCLLFFIFFSTGPSHLLLILAFSGYRRRITFTLFLEVTLQLLSLLRSLLALLSYSRAPLPPLYDFYSYTTHLFCTAYLTLFIFTSPNIFSIYIIIIPRSAGYLAYHWQHLFLYIPFFAYYLI